MMDRPHSSWADVYDLAYQHSFGESYKLLTEVTIQVIEERVRPSAAIVDFGAGTGRLSVPLADRRYEVTAVEPCAEMLDQLKRKCHLRTLRTVNSKMEDFIATQSFDMALCVFTVLLYLLDESSLKKALQVAHASLKGGGLLLVDIPSKMIFSSYSTEDDVIKRSVSVIEQPGDIYRYQEEINVTMQDGTEAAYQDGFAIRYWPQEQVLTVLRELGFVLEADLADRFSGSGSHYYLMKKSDQDGVPDGDFATLHPRQ